MRPVQIFLLAAIPAALLLSGCGTNPSPTAAPATPSVTSAPSAEPSATAAPAPTAVEVPTLAPTTAPVAPAALTAEQQKKAEELLNTACAACHSPSRVTRGSGDSAAWQQVIESMRQKGAVISDDDALLLAQYLAQTYP